MSRTLFGHFFVIFCTFFVHLLSKFCPEHIYGKNWHSEFLEHKKIFAQIHEKRLKPEVLKTSIDHYQLQCQLGFLISLGCIIGSLFSLVQS